jgi:hypothetical protein
MVFSFKNTVLRIFLLMLVFVSSKVFFFGEYLLFLASDVALNFAYKSPSGVLKNRVGNIILSLPVLI